MDYINVKTKDYKTLINDGITLVDFWAPWCGPCRMIAPIIEELATDFKGLVNVAKLNTDEERDIAVQSGIRSIPTIKIYKDGECVETFIGAQSKKQLTDAINKALKQ